MHLEVTGVNLRLDNASAEFPDVVRMSRKLTFFQAQHSRQVHWLMGYTIGTLAEHTHELEPVIPYSFSQTMVIIGSITFKEERYTYDFSSCFFPKFRVMHFQNGDIKLYRVVLLFLRFVKILTKLCCHWSWSRRSTVNNCRVREFQIPDRRAQEKIAKSPLSFAVGSKVKA